MRTLTALSVKGFRPTDGHVLATGGRKEYKDGSVELVQASFRRQFTINFGVLTVEDDLWHIGQFLNDEEQRLTYSYTDSVGTITETDLRVVDNHEEFECEWVEGLDVAPRITLELEEADPRTAYPVGTP